MTAYQMNYIADKSKQHKPIKVKDLRYCKSIKSRMCVYCGAEIPKGDLYYSYKSMFGKRKSRCVDHIPKIYNDIERWDF